MMCLLRGSFKKPNKTDKDDREPVFIQMPRLFAMISVAETVFPSGVRELQELIVRGLR